VRIADKADILASLKFIQNTKGLAMLRKRLYMILEGSSEYLSIVALVNGQVVGISMLSLCSTEYETKITDQFDIESFCASDWNPLQNKYCILKNLVVNPLFENQSRLFCFHIMRLMRINSLIYLREELEISDLATQKTVRKEFVPVKPRRM
jgi:hypothetical protein